MTRVTEGAQGSGLNSKMAASRKLAEGWPQLHLVEDSTGRLLCVQRNIQSSTGAPLTQLPLCNSPLLPPAACNHRRRIQSGAQRRQLGPGRQQSFSLRRTVSGRYPLPGVLIWAGDFNGTLAHNVI